MLSGIERDIGFVYVFIHPVYAPLCETKFRHVLSNFHLPILYFDFFVDLQCVESSMNAYPADQSSGSEHG